MHLAAWASIKAKLERLGNLVLEIILKELRKFRSHFYAYLETGRVIARTQYKSTGFLKIMMSVL